MKKVKIDRSDDDIRELILHYFHQRNAGPTSIYGKKGSAATISTIRKDLKQQHDLTAQEVHRNLSYLQSQNYVECLTRHRAFRTAKGTLQPANQDYYRISAVGIDKIDGPTPYSRDKFAGIKIEATGQNLITIGDGNRINCDFRDLGEALAELRNAVVGSANIEEEQKLESVADLESIQNQLAKLSPNKSIISQLWSGIGWLANIDGVAGLFSKVAALVSHVTGQAAA